MNPAGLEVGGGLFSSKKGRQEAAAEAAAELQAQCQLAWPLHDRLAMAGWLHRAHDSARRHCCWAGFPTAAACAEHQAGCQHRPIQVRKTPRWPRSWANFRFLSLYSHRSAWANLHLLGQPEILPAPVRQRRGGLRAAALGRAAGGPRWRLRLQ